MESLRKRLASLVLGQNIDELCLAWHQAGLNEGVNLGIEQAVHDITTDLLSDAVLSMEVDTEIMRHIIDIVEN